ncbi:MAG TPA: hypothetical protein VG984_02170 [Candidatus Paceibacterota bacterium]|nr:hypothetical protein [Candidatus Paceibacterota bacterium]
MPEQKSPWPFIIFGAVGVVVIAGLAYYFWQKTQGSNTPSNTPPTSQNEPNNVTSSVPSGTQTNTDVQITATANIDQNSLNATSSKPTITGTYTNAYGLEVVVATGDLPLTTALSASIPNVVWSDRSDHGGSVMLSGLSQGQLSYGTFSSKVANSLPDGTYTVGIYFDTIYYPQTDENIARDVRTLLTQGTLTVKTKK